MKQHVAAKAFQSALLIAEAVLGRDEIPPEPDLEEKREVLPLSQAEPDGLEARVPGDQAKDPPDRLLILILAVQTIEDLDGEGVEVGLFDERIAR